MNQSENKFPNNDNIKILPFVFQCKSCSKIIGDSFSLNSVNKISKTINLSNIQNIVELPQLTNQFLS